MKKCYDIIVAGGGPSGCAAALSAARKGMSVLLLEKNGILGGMNTSAMVCPFMAFHSGGKQVVRGIAQEIVDRLTVAGGTFGHLPDPLGVASTITPFEPTILKQIYFDMLSKAENLDVLLQTFVNDVHLTNGSISALACTGKSGVLTFAAPVFIDATGDGDLAALAKVDYNQGRLIDGFAQPLTLMFKIGGIDFQKVRSYMEIHPEQFVMDATIGVEKYVAVSGYFDAVECARREGNLHVERDRVLLFQGIRHGEAIVNMTRVTKACGTSVEEITRAEFSARHQIDEIVHFFQCYIDGFQNIFLVESGDYIGVRETRRIIGQYQLTEEDIVCGKEFDDSVAVCAFPIDIHDPVNNGLHWTQTGAHTCYDVPYRVMVPRKPSNLLVTGRCISATHEAAASVRISPTAMALGEAAGLAAAQAVSRSIKVAAIDTKRLQEEILECRGVPGKRFLK